MADTVQTRLECMLPELDDLEKRGLFTGTELAAIVKTRRKYEYRLKRKPPLKQDFIDYIDYEKHLDRLRLLRKKQVERELKEKGNRKLKTSLSDFAGARRIIELYRMATKRFKGDLELWFQYLEFCKSKKHGRMKKALAEVMKFHPKVPAVWIYAAVWEFEHELNPIAAVNLMLEGLRACPNSEDLWVECIRLILTILNKLKARKILLGEDNGTLVRDGKDDEQKKWREENEDLFMSLDEAKETDDGLDGNTDGPSAKADAFQKLAFIQLQNTYRKAVKSIPGSFSLRKRFLEIVEATDFAQLEEIRAEILADMKRDFSDNPDYWDWLASLWLADPRSLPNISSEDGRRQVDEVIKVYEEAINIAPSVVLFEKYIDLLMCVIHPTGGNGNSYSVSAQTADYISHLRSVFGKAEGAGYINADLVCRYIIFFVSMGDDDKALKLAENFCEGKFAEAKQIWVLRVTEHMRCIKESGSSSRAPLSALFNLLREMVKKVAVSDTENVWTMALELFADDRKYLRKLLDLLLLSLTKDGGSDNGLSLPAALVNFVLQKDGIDRARDLYRRIINLPHPGLGAYKCFIELEISTGDEASIVNARKLFESALATYSQDIRLWREYYSLELKMGTSETANAVYWRAKKALRDASALTAPIIP